MSARSCIPFIFSASSADRHGAFDELCKTSESAAISYAPRMPAGECKCAVLSCHTWERVREALAWSRTDDGDDAHRRAEKARWQTQASFVPPLSIRGCADSGDKMTILNQAATLGHPDPNRT